MNGEEGGVFVMAGPLCRESVTVHMTQLLGLWGAPVTAAHTAAGPLEGGGGGQLPPAVEQQAPSA